MYRHGDVILTQVNEIPDTAHPKPTAVLAWGEATGHSHRISDPSSVQLYTDGAVGYLRVTSESALLVHDEHKPIELPRGLYRFWQQREYSPKEIRTIVD